MNNTIELEYRNLFAHNLANSTLVPYHALSFVFEKVIFQIEQDLGMPLETGLRLKLWKKIKKRETPNARDHYILVLFTLVLSQVDSSIATHYKTNGSGLFYDEVKAQYIENENQIFNSLVYRINYDSVTWFPRLYKVIEKEGYLRKLPIQVFPHDLL